MDLFKELMPALLQTKEEVICSDNEKDYNAFIVNRALSLHVDCLFHAQEMNLLPQLPRILQFHYQLNSITPKRRAFVPWVKKAVNGDEVEAVKRYFGYSDARATEALGILTPDQLETITRITINE